MVERSDTTGNNALTFQLTPAGVAAIPLSPQPTTSLRILQVERLGLIFTLKAFHKAFVCNAFSVGFRLGIFNRGLRSTLRRLTDPRLWNATLSA